MSAGSGSAQILVKVETMSEAQYRTALEIERATSSAWRGIARSHLETIRSLQFALDRYQKRSPN